MPDKRLTLEDVMGDMIDREEQQASARQKSSGTKLTREELKKLGYRTRSGQYVGFANETQIKEVEDGPQAGRKYQTITMKLFTDDQKYRGTTFVDHSWKRVLNEWNGEPDRRFKLFQAITRALHVPSHIEIQDILPAIKGEYFDVWGKEYFTVPVKDLRDAHKKFGEGKAKDRSVRVYFDENDSDADAIAYMKAGYKSRFQVFSIRELSTPSTPATPDKGTDDDIPF